MAIGYTHPDAPAVVCVDQQPISISTQAAPSCSTEPTVNSETVIDSSVNVGDGQKCTRTLRRNGSGTRRVYVIEAVWFYYSHKRVPKSDPKGRDYQDGITPESTGVALVAILLLLHQVLIKGWGVNILSSDVNGGQIL
ncbi:hypothetical protein K443DRAFT_682344 [Laccaria amethystina LaAM-08-1]|uniref:Uncharacterized protein n=1 Tax=Laccaria amethystina LaAM-08-1 TaxID=1095629 RepID=A0A0C9WVC0_9AGAR|nr:hypothetical protein K443DRAFT_682344 [Laccaria amethystina LaAM-08-1]